MPRPNKTWRQRPPPKPWTADEDRVLMELTELGIGLHDHVLEAVLPGRSVSQAIERRLVLRDRSPLSHSPTPARPEAKGRP